LVFFVSDCIGTVVKVSMTIGYPAYLYGANSFATSLKFKQRLNLFFGCLDLFDSCDVGRGELLASVKFGYLYKLSYGNK
jgi:hypothetical protein